MPPSRRSAQSSTRWAPASFAARTPTTESTHISEIMDALPSPQGLPLRQSGPISNGASPRLSSDLQNSLDLDHDAVWQRTHANGRTRMAARLAEHLDHEVRAAVDDLGMVSEIRLGVDHAEKLDHRFDARELTERSFGDREQLQPGETRGFIALLDRGVLAEPPDHETPVRALRPLAGKVEKITRQPIGHIVGHRRRNGGKREAEGGKPLFRS